MVDGIRVQVHRHGDTVRVYTRNLNDVTDRLSGVVGLVQSLPGGDLVLDGEVLGVGDDGSPRRFQDTMGDFGAEEEEDHRGRGEDGVLAEPGPSVQVGGDTDEEAELAEQDEPDPVAARGFVSAPPRPSCRLGESPLRPVRSSRNRPSTKK